MNVIGLSESVCVFVRVFAQCLHTFMAINFMQVEEPEKNSS